MKDFLTYEDSLTVLNMGFNERCFGRYYSEEFIDYPKKFQLNSESVLVKPIPIFLDKIFDAPLYTQVFSWFREKYDLHSFINELWKSTKMVGYYFSINGEHYDRYNKSYYDVRLDCLKELISIVKKLNLPKFDSDFGKMGYFLGGTDNSMRYLLSNNDADSIRGLSFNGLYLAHYNPNEFCVKLNDDYLGPKVHVYGWQISGGIPLYQTVFDWFREKYNLHSFINKSDGKYFFVVGEYNSYNNPYETYYDAEKGCLYKLIELSEK